MIVADASPLIALGRVGLLSLLRYLFEIVAIPTAVENEISRHPRGFEGDRPSWVISHEVKDRLAVQELMLELHRGEAEAIVLATQLNVPILIDEALGRKPARARHLNVTGTLGILLSAKEGGYLNRIEPALVALQSQGFYMSPELLGDVRRASGEM